jgi:hypothetical protein
LFDFLTKRICNEDGTFTERAEEVLQIIHTNFQKINHDDLIFPKVDKLGEDYGLDESAIREMPFDVFKELCAVLKTADIVLLFKLLESQGFDLWL